MNVHDVDKIDKEAGLIKLTVGQICSAGVSHNVVSGDRKNFAVPYMHRVWVNDYSNPVNFGSYDDVGIVIRISNDGTIISNPGYTGNAVIAFIDKKYEGKKVFSVKITKINKRSVNVEPVEILQ